jgi:hypothetical protein
MNKSFILRRQRSNIVPSTSKPTQQQQQIVSKPIQQQQQIVSKPIQQQQQQVVSKPSSRQPLRPTVSIASSSPATNPGSQTNRAVELRRARAQAKMEELSQRTKKQLHTPDHQSDIMSVSWHSNASSLTKKDSTNLQPSPRKTTKTNIVPQQQDISSSSYHRSSSVSPNRSREAPSKYRNSMMSSAKGDQQYQRMCASTYTIEGVNRVFFFRH